MSLKKNTKYFLSSFNTKRGGEGSRAFLWLSVMRGQIVLSRMMLEGHPVASKENDPEGELS